MNRRKVFWERLIEQADLMEESAPGDSIVELVGDRRVLVENHRGVTEYGDQRICVRLRYGMLTVSGCSLVLARMSKELLIITGKVDGMILQRG